MRQIAATGVDFVSIGALTHSAPAIDFSLELTMSPPDRLIAAELEASLGKGIVGPRILVLESTGSTNDFLRKCSTELPEGLSFSPRTRPSGAATRASLGIGRRIWGFGFRVLLRPAFRRRIGSPNELGGDRGRRAVRK